MNLRSYLDLYSLLQEDTSTPEERRAFGLSHVTVKDKPIEQLLAWMEEHRYQLKKPLLSEAFSSTLYSVSLTLVAIAFVLGLLSGIGLLSYNGHEPVNVIYFMSMVIFVPLFTMTLTLFSMLRANSVQSLLVHISPAFWMERLLQLLPHKTQEDLKNLKVNPLLANWIVIKRSQVIALAFSFGLLCALLGMVATKDIAFAWSTTLHVTPEGFHSFLSTLAFPWRDFFPWAVPSVELIEQSQYFRLGDKLSEEMVSNASKLGEWWKFLAFATLFYAIILRFLLYLLSSVGLKRAIRRSFLSLEGAKKLLSDMNEPIISTHAKQNEAVFRQTESLYSNVADSLDASYDLVLGWAIPKEQLTVISESMKVIAPRHYEVGGANTLEEDNEVIHLSHGEILLFVKAWEPPTMDFIDFLEALTKYVDKIVVYPVGTMQEQYRPREKEIDVWARKLSTLNHKKVWLKR
ncbi:DUF2868 domain-containing protein [Sulfurovum sp.]|uniref:DUF2868 domain-containing protein n=2 Tax=Sulfurovum sp. TaxID=1969726 RepID=UPI0025E8425D|nr:DUF2868 domain-containing protein [Sulfurovum sp.]